MGKPYFDGEFQAAVGKTIVSVKVEDNRFECLFEDGSWLLAWDADSQCCERRFLRTDDDLGWYNGATFKGLALRRWRKEITPKGWHGQEDLHEEIAFITVNTSQGELVFSCHNENNGFYEGFNLCVKVEGAV